MMDFICSYRAEHSHLLHIIKIHCLTWLTLKRYLKRTDKLLQLVGSLPLKCKLSAVSCV